MIDLKNLIVAQNSEYLMVHKYVSEATNYKATQKFYRKILSFTSRRKALILWLLEEL